MLNLVMQYLYFFRYSTFIHFYQQSHDDSCYQISCFLMFLFRGKTYQNLRMHGTNNMIKTRLTQFCEFPAEGFCSYLKWKWRSSFFWGFCSLILRHGSFIWRLKVLVSQEILSYHTISLETYISVTFCYHRDGYKSIVLFYD